jgi:hypothetical protein
MRRYRAILAAVLLGASCSCSSTEPVCDLFIGSAIVTGTVRDLGGEIVPGVTVEFSISASKKCEETFEPRGQRAITDAAGRYSILLHAGQMDGLHCVQCRASGSDSVSTGMADFTSSCDRGRAIRSVKIDVVMVSSNSALQRSSAAASARANRGV